MNNPFPTTKLTKADTKRLGPHVSNYNKLNELLLLNGLSPDEIRKLILIELTGKRRPFIIKKLVGRLTSKERFTLLNKILPCSKNNSKPRSANTHVKPVASRTSSPAQPNGVSPTA